MKTGIFRWTAHIPVDDGALSGAGLELPNEISSTLESQPEYRCERSDQQHGGWRKSVRRAGRVELCQRCWERLPAITGLLSGSPEIHEKVSSHTGRGAVVLFATAPGKYEYTTRHRVTAEHWSSGPVAIDPLPEGLVHVSAEFKESGARIVYFGVSH